MSARVSNNYKMNDSPKLNTSKNTKKKQIIIKRFTVNRRIEITFYEQSFV